MRLRPAVLAAAMLILADAGGSDAIADVIARATPVAGSVVAVKLGEEINLIETKNWRNVDVTQEVLAGDILRTNALGQLAVVFSDQTQVRLGRNTTLVVKDIGSGDARFGLESGDIWARAARGGTSVTIDTPAAAAAVRGTDWSLKVGPDGRTALVVLEGQVELANAQGSVLVNAGEGASVGIGEKPTKFLIIDVDDREQMLFYASLHDSFSYMVPAARPSRTILSEHARIAAIPAESRTAEDRVAWAEFAFNFDGSRATRVSVAAARAVPLDRRQEARILLVEALLAADTGDNAGAIDIFTRAIPGLGPEQRTLAEYGRYFSRALADPSFDEPPPRAADGGPYGALANAYAVAFIDGPAAATKVIEEAERRFPDEAMLPAVRAQFALLSGDLDQSKEAVERGLALDAKNPIVLFSRAYYREEVDYDSDGAYADLLEASKIIPGSSDIWAAMGLVQSNRGADREAVEALERALDLSPEDPAALVNLAIHYMENGRVEDSRQYIERAIAIDPELSAAYVARGRYYIQTGNVDAAIEDLLKATTLDPTYSDALLILASAYFQRGDREPGEQALENAERLDKESPYVGQIAAVHAIDVYDADTALQKARDSLHRFRARGGRYATLSASREAGSTLNNAFRLLGLDAWGRAYSDIAFDVFDGGTYFDKNLNGTPNPFTNESTFESYGPGPVPSSKALSTVFQGLMLMPYAAAGDPYLTNTIYPAPFFETSLSASYRHGGEAGTGLTSTAGFNAYTHAPIPFSMVTEVEYGKGAVDRTDVDQRVKSAFVAIGAQPSLYDRLAFIGAIGEATDPVSGSLTDPAPTNSQETFTGYGLFGWSHTIGYRNNLTVGAMAGVVDVDSHFDSRNPGGIGRTIDAHQPRRVALASVSHAIGEGPFTLRYGAEAGWIDGSDKFRTVDFSPIPGSPRETDGNLKITTKRGWADVTVEPTHDLLLEAGLFVTDVDGIDDGGVRVEPRVGAAWSLFDGHTVRVMASRESRVPGFVTFSPVDTAGLEPMAAPVESTGRFDTVAARWDAEWTDRVFTALEYQHQELSDVSLDIPGSFETIDIGAGTLDRVSLTGNAWLGGGVGAFGTVAYTRSEITSGRRARGDALPFVPEWSAKAGLTWVSPLRFVSSVYATWVGERSGDIAGTKLDDFVTVDAKVGWESEDGHVSLDLSAYNLLDEDFELAPDTPGWGRTLVGTLTVRF